MNDIKTIDNIELSNHNFTIIIKGNREKNYQFSNLDKVYIRVSKKNKKQLIVFSIFAFIIFLLGLYYLYNSNGIVFGLSTSIFSVTFLNSLFKKKYAFIVKLQSGEYEEYIIKPENKIKLVDKMRNIRASIDAYKMTCASG